MKALSMKKKASIDNYMEVPNILHAYFKENKIWMKEKEYVSWGFNSHHLYSVLKQSSVPDDVDLPFYVAFVIAIDNITDRRRDDSSVSFGSSNN